MNKIPLLSLFLFLIFNSYNAEAAPDPQDDDPIIQRVRLNFTSPTNYVRHLLLSFTSDDAASDEIDYGYDARSLDIIPYDLNWMIDNERFIIQGVGKFNDQKYYSLGMFMSEDGPISITLGGLENFETEIPVYIYDRIEKTYTPINSEPLQFDAPKGDHLERFYITFSNNNATLSTESSNIEDGLKIYFNNRSNTLTIDATFTSNINSILIYNVEGKLLHNKNYVDIRKVNIIDRQFENSILILKLNIGGTQINKVIMPK